MLTRLRDNENRPRHSKDMQRAKHVAYLPCAFPNSACSGTGIITALHATCLPVISWQGFNPLWRTETNEAIHKCSEIHFCHGGTLSQIRQCTPGGWRSSREVNRRKHLDIQTHLPWDPQTHPLWCRLLVSQWYFVTCRSIKSKPPQVSHSVTF